MKTAFINGKEKGEGRGRDVSQKKKKKKLGQMPIIPSLLCFFRSSLYNKCY